MNLKTMFHRTDPDTSKDAATTASNIEKVMRVIVDVLDEHGPMTPAELTDFYFTNREQWGWPVIDGYSVKRRVSQLKRQVGVLRGVGRRDRGELLNLADNRDQAQEDITAYFEKDAA